LALGTSLIGQRARGEEGGTLVSIEGTVLTGEKLATGFFTHCSGADGAIGLVCRHLGEEALKEKTY
jgi:hypothetical protein